MCFSSVSRGVRARENSCARARVCVYCVLREGFKLENRCDRVDTDTQRKQEAKKNVLQQKKKNGSFYAWEKNNFISHLFLL